MHKFALTTLTLAALYAIAPGVAGRSLATRSGIDMPTAGRSFEVPAAGTIEVAFSPEGGSEDLVIRVVDAASTELRILAYSFTSVPVVAALVRAKKRGVDVRLVADENSNGRDDRSGKARAALSALVNAGISVRTIDVYPIHHDKVIVADRVTVELGSFNYSDAAARRNSENVLVNWHNARLADVYLAHFERSYRLARPYELRY